MSTPILDVTDDRGLVQLAGILSIVPPDALPEYVKLASADEVPTEDQPQTLPSHVFAWPAQRKFACDTPLATFLSWGYFLRNHGSVPCTEEAVIRANLTKFANHHNIASDIESMQQHLAREYASPEIPDSHFLWVNGDVRRYPVRDEHEAKVAADWFLQHRAKFAFDTRTTIATRLMDRLDQLGMSLDTERMNKIASSACTGVGEPDAVQQAIRSRASALGRGEHNEALIKLAQTFDRSPHLYMEEDALREVARHLDSVDRDQLLCSGGLPLPEDQLFSINVKEATEVVRDLFHMKNGAVYSRGQLADSMTPDIVATWWPDRYELTDGVSVDIEKTAAAMQELDPAVADLVCTGLKHAGISPLCVEAAADDAMLSNESWQQLTNLGTELLGSA